MTAHTRLNDPGIFEPCPDMLPDSLLGLLDTGHHAALSPSP
jgi:hypothetical protein